MNESDISSNAANHSDDSILYRLNDEKASVLIPSMVYIGVLMIVGIVGNSSVCCFYGIKLKSSTGNCFIVALAIFDLITCVVSMPMEIADMRYIYTFKSVVACKLLRFTNYCSCIASGGVLIAIATDRYLKICQPFKTQITVTKARIAGGLAALGSVLVSWPSLVFYTIVEIELPKNVNVTVFDCTTEKDPAYIPYILVFLVLQFVIFIAAAIALMVLYSLIARRIFKHKKFTFFIGKRSGSDTSTSSKQTSFTDLSTCGNPNRVSMTVPVADIPSSPVQNGVAGGSVFIPEPQMEIEPDIPNEHQNQANDESVPEDTENNSPNVNTRNDPKTRPTSASSTTAIIPVNKEKKKSHTGPTVDARKYTFLMLTITMVFIVSFLPHLCLMLWRKTAKIYEPGVLPDSQLVAFSIFLRSFLVNCAVNPIIYGFFNSQYRKFVIGVLVKVCCLCCRISRTNKNQGTEEPPVAAP